MVQIIRGWTTEQSAFLVSEVTTGRDSYARLAHVINAKFGTRYSRDAVLGKAHRLGLCKPQQFGKSSWAMENARTRDREKKKQLREKRWQANPSLEGRAERKKETLQLFKATNTPRTSPAYRKHLPHLPEMTKTELRAMLAAAFANTAALEVA